MKKSLLFRNGDSSFCKIYLLVCLLLVGFINLNAQEAPNKKVSLDLKKAPLIDIFKNKLASISLMKKHK